jgi:hypothetical protein
VYFSASFRKLLKKQKTFGGWLVASAEGLVLEF